MGSITYLCGPPGCGKSAHLRKRYAEAVQTGGCDSTIWIAPDAMTAGAVRDAVVRAVQGLYDPRLLTFPALGTALLNANHETARHLDPTQRTLLAGHVASRRDVGLPPKLATRPGYISALCSFVDELKRAAIDPRAFSQAVAQQFPGEDRAAGIARFYQAYQDLLAEKELFDEPGLFWWARALLAEGKAAPFEEARLLIVDGFTDFTTTQLQVLRLLAQRSDETIITIPMAQDEREELFATPNRLLTRMRAQVGEGQSQWLPECQERPAPLQHLVDNLFRFEPAELDDPAGAVQIIAAPGVLAEVREVLREVKSRLLDGVPPGDIGLVFRTLDPYRQALQEVARETGVPLAVGGSDALSARPPVQVVLDVLQVPLADYRQADVIKLLKSNFIDMAPLQPQPAVATEDFELIACQARLIGGREQWIRQLDLYARRLQNEHRLAEQGLATNADDEQVRSLRRIEAEQALVGQCRTLFDNLKDRLAKLEREQTRAQHVQALLALLEGLGVATHLVHAEACAEMADNVAAYEALLEALAGFADADAILDAPEAISFARFASEIISLCAQTQYDLPLRPEGRVVALDVYQARQVRKPYLFLCGLVEGAWPQVRNERPFFDDRERFRLNQAGIALDLTADLQSDEAYLFYLACAAAERVLYLTYPTVDPEGQPLVRSHYVDEAVEVFAANAVKPRQRLLSEVLAKPEEVVCRRELLENAVALETPALWELYAPVTGWAAHVFACAAVEKQRTSREPFEAHDGLLTDAAILANLSSRYGSDYRWSATGLGAYGSCPFSFLLGRVLRLETLEPPAEEVEPLDYGNIIHRILAAFFTLWQTHHPDEPPSAQYARGLHSQMEKLINDHFERWEREGLVTHRALSRLAREQAQRDLSALVDYEINEMATAGFMPRAFETRYEAALPANDGGEVLLTRGKIDRVDVGAQPPAGEPQEFAVYDYKGNDGVAPQVIENGCDFQMLFYVNGARQVVLGGQDPPPECARWAYYRYRTPVKLCRTVEREGNRWYGPVDYYLSEAAKKAYEHVHNIRGGKFQVNPQVCSSYCDFKPICRHMASRVEPKAACDIEAAEVQP